MSTRNGSGGATRVNMAEKAWRTQDFVIVLYIFCYFLISFSFLTEFPFVHSDESWLSGLTRNMMETGDLGVTEPFFDLKPRYPHAVKILFHLLQMPMLSLFGYGVFSFRLLSLLFGCFALILFYLLLKAVFIAGADSWYPAAGTVLLSLDVQFIYASHFARQEILLVCCIVGCMLAVFKKRPLTAGLITGFSIGLHPNSFLVGTMCAAMLLPVGGSRGLRPGGGCRPPQDGGSRSLRQGESSRIGRREGASRAPRLEAWKPLLGYIGITSAFAGFFIALSLSFDRQFFRHYWEYGSSEFDIGAPVTSKFMELPYFFEKIWYRVSGTYYVPDIRLELVLFALAAVAALALLICGGWESASEEKERAKVQPESAGEIQERSPLKPESMAAAGLTLKGIVGMLAGMVIIGRYNQTGVIFLFPLFFVLTLAAIDRIVDHMAAGICRRVGGSGRNAAGTVRNASAVKSGLAMILAAAVAASGYVNISPWLKYSYGDYIKEIAAAVAPQDKVLANLNCEYYFENGKLLDWRNLSYLKGAGLSVEDYIRKNKIEYIILSDEMDFIYSQRPVWNMIYGNLRYMEELHGFLERNCTPVHGFQDNVYGVRIVQYMEPNRGAGDNRLSGGAGGNGPDPARGSDSGLDSAGGFTVQIFKIKDLS